MHIAVDLDAAVSVFLLNAAVPLLLQRYCSATVAAAKLSMLEVSCIEIGLPSTGKPPGVQVKTACARDCTFEPLGIEDRIICGYTHPVAKILERAITL